MRSWFNRLTNKEQPVVEPPRAKHAQGIYARFHVQYSGFELKIDLDLPGHGVTALFGHSGSGKTTCLRCIAGLEQADIGYLEVNGELWQDTEAGFFVPTHKRSLGYVFQEASLFPHLSVRGNLEYGRKRIERAQRTSWDHVLDLLGIEHLLDRTPDRLSGGERQRVGIARALVTNPRLLLMDEPLAALDLKRKSEILPYLERLNQELDIPVLYISHSPDEVARLADHVVLLDQGKVMAQGGLQETMARLDLPAIFTEHTGVVIEARVAEHDDQYHLTRLDFAGGSVLVTERPEPLGQKLRFRVDARDISLTHQRVEGSSVMNILPVRIMNIAIADTPAHVLVRLDAGGSIFIARITRRSCDQLGIVIGMDMWAQIKAVALLA